MPRPQDSKCPASQLYPTFVLSAVSRVVQASLAWCSALSRGRSFFRLPSPQANHSIVRMQRDASLNPCDSPSHRCHTSTLSRQDKRSALNTNHDVALLNHRSHGKQVFGGPWYLQSPRIGVLSLSPLTVSNLHSATPPTSCFKRFLVDGQVADRDNIRLYVANRTIFTWCTFTWCGVKQTFFPSGMSHCGTAIGTR